MASRTDMKKLNYLFNIVKANKQIDKIDLVIKSGYSNATVEKMIPFLLRIFSTSIRFDPDIKKFIFTSVREINA